MHRMFGLLRAELGDGKSLRAEVQPEQRCLSHTCGSAVKACFIADEQQAGSGPKVWPFCVHTLGRAYVWKHCPGNIVPWHVWPLWVAAT